MIGRIDEPALFVFVWLAGLWVYRSARAPSPSADGRAPKAEVRDSALFLMMRRTYKAAMLILVATPCRWIHRSAKAGIIAADFHALRVFWF